MKRRLVLAGILFCFFQTTFGQINLITNGGFENPTTVAPWQFAGVGQALGNVKGYAHSGSVYLTMGTINSANQAVYQTITIPTNAVAVVFNYMWAVLSSDGTKLSQLKVQITDTNLNPLALVDVRSNYDPQSVYRQRSFDLTPYIGQTIVVFFSETSNPTMGALTTFFIDSVSVLAGTISNVPPNNDFVNSTLLTGTSLTIQTSNTFASKEPGEPNHAGNAGGRSLWWRWTAPSVGTLELDTRDSNFNTLLGVYTGTVVSNLTEVISENGIFESSGRARVKFSTVAGTEYQIAVDGFNGVFSKLIMKLKFTPDTTPPVVSFTSPAAGADVTNAFVNIQGKASDTFGVALVQYRLENSAGTNAYQDAAGTNTWSATVTNLVPGANTVRIRAFDTGGNVSSTVTRSFDYIVLSPLTLTISGNGTVTPNLNGQMLAVGQNFSVTAKPGTGYLFSDWTGDVVSPSAKLTFMMRSNMTFQANFITNPFIALAGTYAGLFYSTNGVSQDSAGSFTLALKNTGAFTAKALFGGKSYSVSAQFTVAGDYFNIFDRPGMTPIILRLQLDLAGDTVSGSVSDTIWTADLLGHRAVFSKTIPAPFAGKYTVLIPGADTSTNQPGGDGFGAVNVDTAGNLTFSGMLADGTKLSQKTFVSGQGQWPLFFSLYKGKGLALGWLTITNLGSNRIDGGVTWIKPPVIGAKFYPGGFTNETDVLGSTYVFSNGVPVLNVSTGLVTLVNGNLPQAVTNEVVLGANNKAVGTTNTTSLSITTSSGIFKGSVPNPTPGGKSIAINGVVLQLQDFGGGYFSGTNEIGRVRFGP